jgi:hypothetical protein
MEDDVFSWGYTPASKVTLEQVGECDILTYHNELSPFSSNNVLGELGGHTFMVDLGAGDIPDTFSVTPMFGWEVVTDNFIVVAEGMKGIIQVCQVLLG